MKEDCTSIFGAGNRRNSPTRLSDWYLGAIIIFSVAACIVPIELFIVEIWPRHGLFSLLLVIVPLLAGGLIVQSLPERYYQTTKIELRGRLYELMGIRFFKRVVPNGDYINRINRRFEPNYRIIGDKASIFEYEANTRLAERCHLISLILVIPSAIYALALGWNQFALWLLLPNIPLHLYPVLLQRYTRARIECVVNRNR